MKNRFFDIDEIVEKQKEDPGDRSAILRDNFLKLHSFKVESLKNLNGRLPEPGEFFAIWTLKSFNAFTFIPYLIGELEKIDFILLSTYSINTRIIDSLIKKIDQGKILKVDILISDSIKYRLPKVVDHLDSMIRERDQIAVHYAWNHSKITLVQSGDKYLTIEGSGNWSENAQHEQYLFFNDIRMYEFRKNCINGLY